MKTKIKNLWRDYESKIMLVLGFLLVAVVSFEGGVIKGAKMSQKPVMIDSVAGLETQKTEAVPGNPSQASKMAPETVKTPEGSNTPAPNCAFVGSKNSTKYHLPACQWAKRIKPGNIVCFSSVEEAAQKGYQPDRGCIK